MIFLLLAQVSLLYMCHVHSSQFTSSLGLRSSPDNEVKLLPVHQFKLICCFHILVLRENVVLTESRKLLKLVLGGMRIVALSISSHEQTQ